MNRSIEQALRSLLPTHNAAFPPQLTDLASSLLAQSRHRASTLKAEEEIARPYACAHIACDRLKIALNLPPIDPRPPIPPRIYKRLYSHLEKVLPNSSLGTPKSRRFATPGSRSRDVGSSPTKAAASRSLPSRATPSKEKSLAPFRNGAASGAPSKANGSSAALSTARTWGDESALPSWVQPTVRFLCKELGQLQLGPTIMAGMVAIAAPLGRRSTDAWVVENTTGLLAAIYYYAGLQLARQAGEEERKVKRYTSNERAIIRTLNAAREAAAVQEALDRPEAWEGWHDLDRKRFRDALLEVSDRDWLKSDWFRGIQDVYNNGVDEEAGKEDTATGDGVQDAAQIRKADTMFLDRYDFLSEKKRRDYRTWKDGILERIREARSNGEAGAMEIDP